MLTGLTNLANRYGCSFLSEQGPAAPEPVWVAKKNYYLCILKKKSKKRI